MNPFEIKYGDKTIIINNIEIPFDKFDGIIKDYHAKRGFPDFKEEYFKLVKSIIRDESKGFK